MKIFQYMSYGIIPLVSNVGDLPYYVCQGKAGYIAKSDNIKSLENKFIQALLNSQQRYKKVSYIKNYGEKNFSWQMLTRNLEKVLINYEKN
jgi:glycosyltransferase involved in cell wall biosynthesis